MEKQKEIITSPEEQHEMACRALGGTALNADQQPPAREMVEEKIYINGDGQLAIPSFRGRTETMEIVVH